MSLGEDLQRAVDERRGLVPRTAWIRAAVEHYLDCDRLAIRVSQPSPNRPLPRTDDRPPVVHVAGRPTGVDHEWVDQKQNPNRCGFCGLPRGRHQ